jgi:adenosylhomocysteinase
MGAQVIVTEVDPTRALEAVMEGYQVMTLLEAAPQADVVITVTGDCNVVDRQHFESLKDGCIVANSGHFNSEINLAALDELTSEVSEARPLVAQHTLANGRRLYLLAEGRLLNLSAAEGHPASVMDMSFANQALAAAYLVAHAGELTAAVHDVPLEIDQEVAQLKLAALGVEIDVLTDQQQAYLSSWEQGTD